MRLTVAFKFNNFWDRHDAEFSLRPELHALELTFGGDDANLRYPQTMNVKLTVLTILALTSNAWAVCNHPYVPSTPNTRWTYKSSIAGGDYTMRVVSNDGQSFVLENAFKTMKIQSKVRCASDGSLVQEQYSSITGLNAKTETLSFSGVAFPAPNQWVIGGKWTHAYKIKMSITAGDQIITQAGTVTISSKIVNSENVSVPAGKFTALKVAQTINLDLMMKMTGGSRPIKTTVTTTTWYARDVGVVKSISDKVTSMLTDFVKV